MKTTGAALHLPPDIRGRMDNMTTEEVAFQNRVLLSRAEGDISDMLSPEGLSSLAADVIRDYETDLVGRKNWQDKAEAALKAAAQEKAEQKDTPWQGASNVKYPLLTVAALQFNARAYPAIVKGDEAVGVKVVGRDFGRPVIGPDGQPLIGPDGQPAWAIPPGAKKRRSLRVKDYMNTTIFYRMEGWEVDTDQLLAILPIVGCAFRKVTWKYGKPCVRLVSALKLVAPVWATCTETAPRLTEVIDTLATYQVQAKITTGEYRDVELTQSDEDPQKPRVLLEQHRFEDIDGDGIAEPYIITVDKETSQILRIEPNFSEEEALKPGQIKKRSCYYVKYDFFPNPEGEFYGIGFGHLLDQITEVINTMFNQMIDAGTAANAGGGFIASGIRLQGKGPNVVRWRPGEYKVVDVPGSALREGMIERTFPKISPVSFQLLDMMMAAARDITSVKDVITGDASNNGQVGTTLALIEQGLAQFTAVYKRVYRALKAEFQMIFDAMSLWGGEEMAADYVKVLDDPEADFQNDFNGDDFDIRPVSDPTSVTKMQKIGQAQFMLGLRGGGLDDIEIMKRALEAADIEDIEGLMPKGENPMAKIAAAEAVAKVKKTEAEAERTHAQAQGERITAMETALNAGLNLGAMNDFGGLSGVAGEPGDAMGIQ